MSTHLFFFLAPNNSKKVYIPVRYYFLKIQTERKNSSKSFFNKKKKVVPGKKRKTIKKNKIIYLPRYNYLLFCLLLNYI